MKHLCLMALLAGVMAMAQAEEICKVTDPTGTPLNVRAGPNQRIIGQLKNFTVVTVMDYDSDVNNNTWALVRWQGQPISYKRRIRPNAAHEGWVFREFISCYAQ